MNNTESRSAGGARKSRLPLIVGVGASASKISSLERFFSKLSVEADQAIVLVLQHREALNGRELRTFLKKSEGVIAEPQNGSSIEGGTIYVCPVGMITTIQGDHFAVRSAEHALGERATIDSFLVSLAEQRSEQAIGVVLAGTGGDGTLGAAALKDCGGLAIAERVSGKNSTELADGNSALAIADFVLPADQIPEHVDVYARHLRRLEEKQGFDGLVTAVSTSLLPSEHRAVENRDSDSDALVRTDRVGRLERELRTTRERLQATIEELESTKEELKSSDEEHQSLNEELRCANEELEFSRGELRSMNETLTIVNGELAHRVQELTRATSDLKNFFESAQIATIFLDNRLRVMNFTPAMTQVLPLVETDIGRPIAHINARIPIEELDDDLRRVLRTLASAEREMTAPDSGTRYIVRVLPYRSIDNVIAGVVITFIDVTAIKRAEDRQRLLLGELQHRVRNTLGAVRSIVRRSAETSSNVEEYASHLDGRLNAFVRTQALVTRDPEGGVDLEYLIVEELLGYNATEGEQLRVSGPVVRLQPKAAETFALAIHELATNALKYGALSRPSGCIEVDWQIDEAPKPPQLVFIWRERGGPPVRPPSRRGFGTELLERTLAFEFKGRTAIAFDAAGLQCVIKVPLSQRILHTPNVST